MNMNIQPLGDQALIIDLGDSISEDINKQVRSISSQLDQIHPDWMIEYIPAFTTITVIYNPLYIAKQSTYQDLLPFEWARKELLTLLSDFTNDQNKTRTVEIPVCYGGEWGPDLTQVASHNRMSEEEVIEIHLNGDYLVYMIGFAPGFPYIGGMDKEIATPRRDDPRLSIPAGSVGVAGEQTGVYPIETPGGWQLIGRTPLKLFDPERDSPSLLQAGDRVRFTRIHEKEYKKIEEDEK
ncbi:inhibitor of KinA [Halobacillus karajensis]|uniref:Sporulation inhibitor KipI n=1 Tax=Halobacillus karajensis TaxID=195088 RepID=A0A024P5J1_9BACI|nr:5-oxoprolinase subunit PxpB [Halobacillus karajensis]CDQ20488.1 Sporulation inhibitor KipI [Halobacillus karajensis]CDQ24043.1 Sporulation inhibitor KipI [Halobacillus karajensis]CDQ27521.1 Sporulation inhibitor KipI [Halobacillus karajensis]SEH90959.1 inhibitor of KinA [Halobacillus karajensis]